MNKLQIKRLEKVANSTHKKILPDGVFDFYLINSGAELKNKCNAVGCKMHLFPLLFPKKFYYSSNTVKSKRRTITTNKGIQDTAKFFGLDYDEFKYLFYPSESGLGNATERQVNNHIKKFLKSKLKNK